MSNNAHELSNRLLNALDNNYNVVDMQTVNEIISILERFNITKELLETTRLGKHVNELRRKTADPTLARRAKVLVKRWRDLVIPAVASPAHTGSNRSSAERTVRRLGGTPLTSPALQRQGLSPAVPSPRPPSRPAWGGYESDSQDVILVDDEPPSPRPPPALHAHKPLTPPVKRPPSPEPLYDEKKAKRDKKPKKRRGHGRAGTGTESPGGAPAPASAAGAAGAAGAWRERNGTSERRRNGCRKDALDPYTALVSRMPKVGDKKVKTTQELLQQIQSRGARPASPASPRSPRSPRSPDVMLIEPDAVPIKVDSPLRNGGGSPAPGPTLPTLPPLPRARSPLPPLEDEREYHECTCGEQPSDACPAARRAPVQPLHVHALHHAHIPGVNGTRAPPLPHQYAVRAPAHPARPDRFDNVVPLYKYSDYADDYCVKNMAQVPLCSHLPWTEFAPPPPPPPEPPSPPPPRPYPVDDEGTEPPDEAEVKLKVESESKQQLNERLKEPAVGDEEPPAVTDEEPTAAVKRELRSHRSVERTRAPADGRALWALARATAERVPWSYAQLHAAPVLALPATAAALDAALASAAAAEERDALGRPPRAAAFSEWHESARLGELLALPYVVLD